MSRESRTFVRIPESQAPRVLELADQALQALARSAKQLPGERTEALRFEAIHASIDQIAISALGNNAPFEFAPRDDASALMPGPTVIGPGFTHSASTTEKIERWIREGAVVVELRLPHGPGATIPAGTQGAGPPKPAERWTSSYRRDVDAIQERFRHHLAVATHKGPNDSHSAALYPSGIPNRILTESLREFADSVPGISRVDVPVIYRDQSRGRPFPLRSLVLSDSIPAHWRKLRFTLISIRHVEMDAIVDGAWLRNVKISRSRPAGLTDDIVYELSLRQLSFLTAQQPTVIAMYQTGLETAVVGFYRAVTEHLIHHPNSLCVVPHYYQSVGDFARGHAWTTTGASS
ncbi:MAG: hypothetical protein K1Y02_06120 [Candidatus Hydrogenedentes bacterium]|nr:hypothetical protein [Candidatus Hydrogenedentota bacterium]